MTSANRGCEHSFHGTVGPCDERTHADIACPYAVPVLLQEGMNTSGISVTKSSQDTRAIVEREREQKKTGGKKCH